MPRTSVAVVAALLVLAVGAPAALGAGGRDQSFAQVLARARLVVVATVEAAPPEDPAFRLGVEEVLKGSADAAGAALEFPAEPTSVVLQKGRRVVLLAMDPATLDFRGTVALDVRADGTIDPDGLAGVPATVADLVGATGGDADGTPDARDATQARATADTAATATAGGDPPDPALPWGTLLVLVLVAVGAAAALAARERRGG